MQTPTIVDACAAPRARLILAHGAGAPMDSEFMNSIAALCQSLGLEVVRFEFPYMAQRREGGGKRPPNKQQQLLQCWLEVVEQYSDDDLPLFIGGKSMGGRMATLLAASGGAQGCCGVICLGYPFHPQGQPHKLRIDHLAQIPLPTLIVQGARDAFGSQVEVSGYPPWPQVEIHWSAAADHNLRPLKRSNISPQQALDDVAQAVANFVSQQAALNEVNFSTALLVPAPVR